MPFLATASQQQGNSATGLLILLLPLLLIGLLFWQQRRRQKQLQQAQAELTIGQEVSTTSGLMGRLVAMDDQTAQIEAAPGVQLTFDRRAVLPRPTLPGQAGADADARNEDDTVDPDRDEPTTGSRGQGA